MARRRTEDKPSEGKQINFRAPNDLSERLDAVASGLGLDVSNLVRMVLYENLDQYEERVARLKGKKEGE